MGLQWEGKIGPAAIIGAAQLVLWIGGGAIAWKGIQDGQETQHQQIVEVHAAVEELKRANTVNSERVTRVEEETKFVVRSLDRIEKKIDTAARP